jgi:response regulator RpfG family c-di-GMP phosphodiesterase
VLIISDLRMPEPNGMEFIKRIKDMNPLVRTMLMTAFVIKDELFQEYLENQIFCKSQ